MSSTQTIGIIDLGSNSSRLSIFEHTDNAYRPVFEMKQSLQLAHHLVKSGAISEVGIQRAIACTRLFRRTGELYGVSNWIAVATAAIRQANNRDTVLRSIEEETGVQFRVLDGTEEGYYGYLAVVNTLDVANALVFDIGGASSELMLVQDRQLRHVISLPYGALNLTEMYADAKQSAGEKTRNFFRKHLRAISWIAEASGLPLVGLGGTARAIGKLQISRQENGPLNSIHGYEVRPDFVNTEFSTLAKMDPSKIAKIKGISKRRAGIITAGMAAVSAIIAEVSPTTLLISRNGIREGLFFESYLHHRVPPLFDSVLHDSICNFQKVYDVHEPVAAVVTQTSLDLFDALQSVHKLTEHDRKLLHVTARIESCGTYINTEKWTRHSAYLALSSNLYGLTYSELVDVADLLAGKGSARLKKLSLIMKMAKLFSLQLGIDISELNIQIQADKVMMQHPAYDLREQVTISADADIEHEFDNVFGRTLRLQA